ncbi:peptidase S9 [Sanguibacteroides justesenii]|uniref:Peptidase S9 n=2 Tax=Sanguibacteroides justesenii TaxID=1547597 RepID=A0AB34R4D8_9PORP|nr:peptidase S9 [Sanguibacteroides justesenii]
MKIMRYVTGVLLCLVGCTLYAQETDELRQELKALRTENGNLRHENDKLMKKMDDVLWYNKVGDVAYIDKVLVCGPPRANVRNPTEMGAKNPLKFWAYVFIPKTINTDKKYPLIVFAHSGVHSDFSTYYAHIIRELMAQGYIVVAAEYRGSTGYGKQTYDNIDYGGLENEDVYESRNHMIENYSFVDKNRIGIIGWSHGGMIALMNLFQHPDAYVCGFAGVPVSDIVMRMGYASDSYRKIFSDKNHIGKTAKENLEEYKRRSPVWHAEKLKTPLLIHTNTNDDDVSVLEVEHMIRALKAEGKKFEYRIFEEIPGGHSFDRIDTKQSTEIRYSIYQFLAKYLKPEHPFKSHTEMRKAAYRFN